jgi:hypothetical protein
VVPIYIWAASDEFDTRVFWLVALVKSGERDLDEMKPFSISSKSNFFSNPLILLSRLQQ